MTSLQDSWASDNIHSWKKGRYSSGKQQGAEYILSVQAVKVHLLKTLIEELLKK